MNAIEMLEKFCESVSGESSRVKKLELVKHYEKVWDGDVNFDLFCMTIQWGLNPTAQFFVELPESEASEDPNLHIHNLLLFLGSLLERKFTQAEAVAKADEMKLGKWTRRLINKTLRLGVGSDKLNDILNLQLPSSPWPEPEKLLLEYPQDWTSLFFDLKPPCYTIPMPRGIQVMFEKKGETIRPFSHHGFPLRNIEKFEAAVLRQFKDVPTAQIFGKLFCGGAFRETEIYSKSEYKAMGHTGIFAISHWIANDELHYEMEGTEQATLAFAPWREADFQNQIPQLYVDTRHIEEVWIYEAKTQKFYRVKITRQA